MPNNGVKNPSNPTSNHLCYGFVRYIAEINRSKVLHRGYNIHLGNERNEGRTEIFDFTKILPHVFNYLAKIRPNSYLLTMEKQGLKTIRARGLKSTNVLNCMPNFYI